MRIAKRLAVLEAKSPDSGVSLTLRAWLGEPLTADEWHEVGREVDQPAVPMDWSSISKETQEWWQRRNKSVVLRRSK